MRLNVGAAGVPVFGVALGFLFAALASRTTADPSTGHGYETKSFTEAYLECLQYLNISQQAMLAYDASDAPDAPTNCLLRCIGLNLRWWDDRTGLAERALLQYFRRVPPADDALAQARTCVIDKFGQPIVEPCAAAYGVFRCYSDALGEVVASPQYVVPNGEEARQIVRHCALVLQVSPESGARYVAADSFLLDDKGTSLLRCVATRLGLYTDAAGVLSERLQLLAGSDTPWTDAEEHLAKLCEVNVRDSNADVCHVAAHSVETCYGQQVFGKLWAAVAEEFGRREAPRLAAEETMAAGGETPIPAEATFHNDTDSAKGGEQEPQVKTHTLVASKRRYNTDVSEGHKGKPLADDSAPEQVFLYSGRRIGNNRPFVVIAPLQSGLYMARETEAEDSADDSLDSSQLNDLYVKPEPDAASPHNLTQAAEA